MEFGKSDSNWNLVLARRERRRSESGKENSPGSSLAPSLASRVTRMRGRALRQRDTSTFIADDDAIDSNSHFDFGFPSFGQSGLPSLPFPFPPPPLVADF